MLDKREYINELLDWYAALLTEKQQDVMQLHYGSDFSLSEIAEECSISRSAVYDLIKRSEQTLEAYEAALHDLEKFKKRSKIYKELRSLQNEKVNALVHELENIDTDNDSED